MHIIKKHTSFGMQKIKGIHQKKNILTCLKILFLLILGSCSLQTNRQSDKQSSFVKINFNDIQNKNLNASEIINTVRFIPLETTQECAISSISKLEFYNDTIFIRSEDDIFLFTTEGKFICQFANKGRGPEEYTQATDFSIDRQNHQVIIYDIYQDKIYIYNTSGKFIKTLQVGKSWQIEPIGSNLFLSYPINLMGNQPYSLVLMNENGDTLKNYKNELTYEVKGEPILVPAFGSLYHLKNNVCFKQFLSDTLYLFDKETLNLVPRYAFEGANSLPLELLGNYERFNKESDNFSWLTRVWETDNLLFFTIHNSGEDKRVVYLKEKKMLFPVESNSGNKTYDKNINLSSFYWPRFKLSENTVVKDWAAIYFKEYFKNIKSDKESLAAFREYGVDDFSQLYESINIEDNPIIQITTLK